jgi:hypothetical protein
MRAWLEAVPDTHLAARCDLASRLALKFGVTAPLEANKQYKGSQTFAAAALRAGYQRIGYLLGHDPAQRLYGSPYSSRGVPPPTRTIFAGLRQPPHPAVAAAGTERDVSVITCSPSRRARVSLRSGRGRTRTGSGHRRRREAPAGRTVHSDAPPA